MKKRIVLILVVLIAISMVMLSSCGKSKETQDQAAKGKVVIKFGGINNAAHPAIRAMNEVFKPRVEELTNGQVEVQVFDNGQLGGERDMMEQLQAGVLHMAYVSPVFATVDPAINVMDLPFLFADEEHVDKAIDGGIAMELLKDLPAKGLVPLAYYENGFRVITNSRRPIVNLPDIKGLKIRTPEAPISVAIFNALGANVTPMAFGELYCALQQKVVDGQENAYNTVASSRLFEVQKYVAETNHMWGAFVVLASTKWWDTLDADLQEAISVAAAESSTYQRKLFREETAQSKQMCLDGGMVVSSPDMAQLSAAVQSVYEDFYKQYPQYKSIVERIQALR
jgi:tripartite ATP-independent transporter DctP family solute receptor